MTHSETFGTIYGLRVIGGTEYRYVGLTRASTTQRWRWHTYAARYRTRSQPMYLWMIKHGVENVEMVVLESCLIDELQSREIYWIAHLKSEGHRLLNATTGGDGGVGRIVTAETRKLISAVHKGKTLSAETREKLRIANLGKEPWNKGKSGHLTEEMKARYSAARKGTKRSAETRAKMSAALIGNTNGSDHKGIPKRSGHTRYHTNRSISKPENCKYCKEDIDATTNGEIQ